MGLSLLPTPFAPGRDLLHILMLKVFNCKFMTGNRSFFYAVVAAETTDQAIDFLQTEDGTRKVFEAQPTLFFIPGEKPRIIDVRSIDNPLI